MKQIWSRVDYEGRGGVKGEHVSVDVHASGKRKKRENCKVWMFVLIQGAHVEIGLLCARLSHVGEKVGGCCNFKRAPGQGNISGNTMNSSDTKRNKNQKKAVNALPALRGARLR